MKMTEKTKRQLAIGGGIAICAGLLAAIGLQFAKPPAGEDILPGKESGMAEAIASPPHAVEDREESTEGTEAAIQPLQTEQPKQSEPPAQTEQPKQSEPPAQTEQPKQSEPPIQTEQPKQSEPSTQTEQLDAETLANPEKKPDGTRVGTSPEPVDHDTYVPSADDRGGNSGGLPGFGSVPNGGANTENQAGNMYENGNKIGSMD